MKENPVSWFEIPVNEMERAQKFYEYILDCKLDLQDLGQLQMAWFPFNHEAPGATGTLIKNEAYTPSYAGTMVYFSVEDIDSVLERVKEKGGKIINPKSSIGEHGFVGHFEDSEGNRVALHSNQ